LTAERAEEDEPPSVALPTDSEDGGQAKKIKKDENFGASAHRSKLEQMTGKRNHVGLSQEEMGERFSFLKNAPLEGTFARNIQLQHKPFNEVIRNVQCLRCGEWGHQSGDRECPMRDNNPHDLARQRREDPLTYMKSDNFLAEKQKVALRHAHSSLAKPSSQSRGGVASSSSNGENRKHTQSSRDDDNAEDVESDPEAEFIATLSKREKKLLLMRLEALENGLPPPPIPDTSSSESSSESEGDDDSLSSVSIDNDVFGPQLQNKSHRHRNKKSKKSKKSKTKKERKERKEKNNTKHRHKD
jgi:CBF1 interacting corepressor